jgi:hypothetical protein
MMNVKTDAPRGDGWMPPRGGGYRPGRNTAGTGVKHTPPKVQPPKGDAGVGKINADAAK